jgi:hypothetical protein
MFRTAFHFSTVLDVAEIFKIFLGAPRGGLDLVTRRKGAT